MDVSQVKWKAQADFQQAISAFQQLETAQTKLETTAAKMPVVLNNHTKAISNAGQVGMQFNRIIQDSPFFLSNFSMGIMSIQNNLPVLIESLKYATASGATFKTMLAGMFTGMGGILTIVSIVTAGITAFALANRGGAKDAKDHAKAIDEVAEAMKRASKAGLGEGVTYNKAEIDKINAEIATRTKTIKAITQLPLGTPEENLKNLQALATEQKLLAIAEKKKYEMKQQNIELTNYSNALGIVENKEKVLAEKTLLWKQAQTNEAKQKAYIEMKAAEQALDAEKGKTPKEKKIFGVEEMLPQEYNKYLEAFFDSSKRMTEEKFAYEAQKLRDKYSLDLQYFGDNETLKKQAAESLEDGLTALRKKLSDDTWAYDLENYRKSIKKRLGIATPLELEKSDIQGISKPSSNWLTDEEQKNKVLQEQRKQYKSIAIIADSAAGAIGNTFKKMWSSVFGEADNLLTDFLNRMASGFIDLAANAISGGIFSGLMSALDLSKVSGGGGSTPGVLNNSPIVIPVQLGDQNLATVVAYGYNKAQRLRY